MDDDDSGRARHVDRRVEARARPLQRDVLHVDLVARGVRKEAVRVGVREPHEKGGCAHVCARRAPEHGGREEEEEREDAAARPGRARLEVSGVLLHGVGCGSSEG